MAGEAGIGANDALQGKQYYKNDELAYGISNSYIKSSIETDSGTVDFIATSIPVQAGGDLKEYKDNTGRTCSVVIPEAFQTSSISGLVIKKDSMPVIKKGALISNLPTPPGMMSGGDIKWRVQDCSINWQNEDVAQVTLTVKTYTF